MDGMTINHIVSIDHGSRVNNVQVEWRDRRSTSVTPSHHQKPPYCHIAGIFLWYSTKLQDATRNPGKIGVYELDSRYISINLGKLPLESENAWLCSPPTHSSRGKSLVAMDFQGCLLRAESVLLLRRPGELGLSIILHLGVGFGLRPNACCAKPQFGQKGGPLADCRTKFPSPLPFDDFLYSKGVHRVKRSLANVKQYVMVWLNAIEKPTINGNFRILKWRYCTIFLAIFSGDIPLHRPYIGLIYGRYLQFRFLRWPAK